MSSRSGDSEDWQQLLEEQRCNIARGGVGGGRECDDEERLSYHAGEWRGKMNRRLLEADDEEEQEEGSFPTASH